MSGITISELAERAGVKTSTVRYYERVGLVPNPDRNSNGYRNYDADHETRLRFITRARKLGLSIEQIAELLSVWNGTNCATTRTHVARAVDANLVEINDRIVELQLFAAELQAVREALDAGPSTCGPDLSCCTPTIGSSVPVTLTLGRPS